MSRDFTALRRCREVLRRLRAEFAKPDILAVLGDQTIGDTLRGVILPGDWRLQVVGSVPAAIELAQEHPYNTIILDRALVQENWPDAVLCFCGLPARPVVLVISRQGSDTAWEELAQCGAYGALHMPFQPVETKATIYAGWLLWNNQQQLRELTR